MRLDVLLKSLCLVKTRSQGRKGCEVGRIKVNGRAAKPSGAVKRGDLIEIQYPGRILLVELTDVPAGQVSRKEADGFYRIVREVPRSGDGDLGF